VEEEDTLDNDVAFASMQMPPLALPVRAAPHLPDAQASVSFRTKEKEILDRILGPEVYDRRIRPGGPGGADSMAEEKSSTVVNVNIYL